MNHRQATALRRELIRVLMRTSDGAGVIVALKDMIGEDIAHQHAAVVVEPNDYLAVSNVGRLGDFPLTDFGLRYGTRSRPGFFEPAVPRRGLRPFKSSQQSSLSKRRHTASSISATRVSTSVRLIT